MNMTKILDETNSINRPMILYHCGAEQCRPSHSYGPAIRPHYLMHYISHGKGTYYVNGKTYPLKGGEGFLIYPGVTTTYTADEKDPWEYCWIGFDGSDVRNILPACGLTPTNHIFYDQSGGLLWKDLQQLSEIFNKKEGNQLTLLSQLYLCFSRICPPVPPSANGFHESYVDDALNYIHNNYTYDIKISHISDYLHIDRTYLYKLFMIYVKISPQQYLIDYRITVAEKLLKETDLSMTEIAYSCGFRDASSFNKHFKKRLQTTPQLYRKVKQIGINS